MKLIEFLVAYSPYITVSLLIIALFVNAWAAAYFVRSKREMRRLKDALEWQEKTDILERDALRSKFVADLSVAEQKRHNQRVALETQIEIFKADIASMYREIASLRSARDGCQQESSRLRQDYNTLLSNINTESFRRYREKWFAFILTADFTSSEEIGLKLALPLLVFLGYDLTCITRADYYRIIGANPNSKTWNWMISDTRNNLSPKDLFLLQIAETKEKLTDEFIVQTGETAWRAGLAYYVITNGRHLYLCNDRDPKNLVVLDCQVTQLEAKWREIESTMAFSVLAP